MAELSGNPQVKPFLKWAGGKRQLISQIQPYLPAEIDTYYEPFIGGGALFFSLQQPKVVINDSNGELINCYRVIKNAVEELIALLAIYQQQHDADYFYQVRAWDRTDDFKHKSLVERAARLIYLNRTCYNGLFRVNAKGQFNVPFGRYKNPKILDEPLLRAISAYLNIQSVAILNCDFEMAVVDAKRGDFVYFDPPYDPVSATASFTSYDSNGFNKREQERLKNCVDDLTARGCRVLVSNAATTFIEKLYQDYDQVKISANRAINSVADKRGKIPEVLIHNRPANGSGAGR